MTEQEKSKWRARSKMKSNLLRHGAKHISGIELNRSANLPADAVWREENFA